MNDKSKRVATSVGRRERDFGGGRLGTLGCTCSVCKSETGKAKAGKVYYIAPDCLQYSHFKTSKLFQTFMNQWLGC